MSPATQGSAAGTVRGVVGVSIDGSSPVRVGLSGIQ
jgi:hypothetical protein